MQQATAQFRVTAPVERIYDLLSDVESIGWCIAGVKDVRAVDQSTSEWKVEVRSGIISQTISLRVMVTERNRPNSLAFKGEGKNADLSGVLELRQDGSETEVSFKAAVSPKGPLGPIIEMVMGKTTERLTQETVERIRKKLEEAIR